MVTKMRWKTVERTELAKELRRRNTDPDDKDVFVGVVNEIQKVVLDPDRRREYRYYHQLSSLVEFYRTYCARQDMEPIASITEFRIKDEPEPEPVVPDPTPVLDATSKDDLANLVIELSIMVGDLSKEVSALRAELVDQNDTVMQAVLSVDPRMVSDVIGEDSTPLSSIPQWTDASVKPRVYVVGPKGNQQTEISQAFGDRMRLSFTHEGDSGMKSQARNSDVTILMTKFTKHTVFGVLQRYAGKKLVLVNGGVDSVKTALARIDKGG